MNQGQSPGLDAIQVLEEQHREVETLFDELDGATGEPARRLMLEIADALDGHAVIEERHFYPAVRAGDTEDLVKHSYDEHHEVKLLLLQLLDADPSDGDFEDLVDELRGMVEDHVEEEENDLFPRVRRLLSGEQLVDLGREMMATMAERQLEGEPRDRVAQDMQGSHAQA